MVLMKPPAGTALLSALFFILLPPNRLRCFFFFFNDTATTEIYTLSLHDALPISAPLGSGDSRVRACRLQPCVGWVRGGQDRKSTRLNSSHQIISYAVFCLKKKKTPQQLLPPPVAELVIPPVDRR